MVSYRSLWIVWNKVTFFNLWLDEYHALESMLPTIFLNQHKKGNHYCFTTMRLLCLNDRIQESLNEVYLMSEEIIAELVSSIIRRIVHL